MSITSLPWAFRSLKSSTVYKQYSLTIVSRNVLTALRPATQNAPLSRVSRSRPSLSHWIRRYSSLCEKPEQDDTAHKSPELDVAALETHGLHESSSDHPAQYLTTLENDLKQHKDGEKYLRTRTVSPTERAVDLPISSGSTYFSFGKSWLRDNCKCKLCRHSETGQRIVDTFSIPWDIGIENISRRHGGVVLKWSDGHTSSFPYAWLYAHSYEERPPSTTQKKLFRFRPSKTFRADVPELAVRPMVSYEEVMSGDQGVSAWVEKIHTYKYDWGYCFVKDTPVDPESTEALLKRIAFVRHTHYGGFWDFTADMRFKDTAYTNESLGAHTDNTYFTDPARLQLFHLLSHSEGEGGQSLLVDGYEAAKVLLAENKEHARILTHTKHPFHASGNQDVSIQPMDEYATFWYHPRFSRLAQIRWNNYDRAPKWNWALEEQHAWYEAAKHFDEILRRPSLQFWTQLEPGTALIFDNWRMLHGRSGFSGKRRMCGGYINNDDFLSRYRLLKFGREQVMRNIGSPIVSPKNPNFWI